MEKPYRIQQWAIVGPGLDETEDADCHLALEGVSTSAACSILELINRAYCAGKMHAQLDIRKTFGVA